MSIDPHIYLQLAPQPSSLRDSKWLRVACRFKEREGSILLYLTNAGSSAMAVGHLLTSLYQHGDGAAYDDYGGLP